MKVGILTMHKVVNFGSALQAYAIQVVIQKMGHNVELIDYLFPNKAHLKHKVGFLRKSTHFLSQVLKGFPLKKKRNAFEKFWENNYILSKYYADSDAIKKDPPLYDVYIVGSDQVWNPKHICDDNTFFLDFVSNNSICFSYASSFAQLKFSKKYEKNARKYLSVFKDFSVREKDGVEVIKRLLDRKSIVTLDPTLLLSKKDYLPLIQQSKLKIGYPFILVYVLDYAYDPYPYVLQFINKLQEETGYGIVCIEMPLKHLHLLKNARNVQGFVAPSDFLYLFSNASIVVTTSFHGTAFSLNFDKPLYAVVNDESNGDNRIVNLLKLCGASCCIVTKNTNLNDIDFSIQIDSTKVQCCIDEMRQTSIDYLKRNLV